MSKVTVFVGLDYHKDKIQVCVMDPSGQVLANRACPNDARALALMVAFFGDQVRRRDIVTAMAEDRTPDFSHGFANRPQTRGDTELAGTEYEDGWGAHCYVQHARANDNDKSFADWTCAEGLTCQTAGETTRMGMCFVKTR